MPSPCGLENGTATEHSAAVLHAALAPPAAWAAEAGKVLNA